MSPIHLNVSLSLSNPIPLSLFAFYGEIPSNHLNKKDYHRGVSDLIHDQDLTSIQVMTRVSPIHVA